MKRRPLPPGILLALLATFLMSSCDERGENYLDGSLADVYDLNFDSTRIRQYESELSIEYVNKTNDGEKVALRITINTNDAALAPNTTYDLLLYGSIGRGQGFDSPLPELESGEMRLEKFSPEDGSRVSGTFSSIFMEEDGSSLTLHGGFSSKLENVDL